MYWIIYRASPCNPTLTVQITPTSPIIIATRVNLENVTCNYPFTVDVEHPSLSINTRRNDPGLMTSSFALS